MYEFEMNSQKVYSGVEQKCYNLKMPNIFKKWSDFDNIFSEDPDKLQVFCAMIWKTKYLFFIFTIDNLILVIKKLISQKWCLEVRTTFSQRSRVKKRLSLVKMIKNRPFFDQNKTFFSKKNDDNSYKNLSTKALIYQWND